MADVHTPEQRSYNMSRIRGKITKPEELVRKYLFAQGLRYRKNDARFPGKPDIVLPKYKTVIFVNGCFWHAHNGCKYFVWPKSNVDFWKKKINGNIQIVSPVGKIVDHGREICLPSGMEKMGPVTQKLYDTLTGIQMGHIEAPEGWIHVIK